MTQGRLLGRRSWLSGRWPLILMSLFMALPCGTSGQDVTLFDDRIEAPIREAIHGSNPQLRAARAALASAEARIAAAGWTAPAILTGELEEVSGGTRIAEATFRIEVERDLFTGGRRSATRAVAAVDAADALVGLEVLERALALRGAVAAGDLIYSTAIERRLIAEDSLLQAAEESVRDRFAVGEARYVDVLRLRTERLRIQSDRADAFARARTSRATLLALVGESETPGVAALLERATETGLEPLTVSSSPPLPPLDSLVTRAANLRRAGVILARARAERDLVIAEQRPAMATGLGVQRVGSELGGGSFGPTLTLSLSLPFTAARANRAALASAESRLTAAEELYRSTEQVVRAELAVARERYEAARTRLEIYQGALLRGAAEERESALSAYRGGEISLLELLDFERALARAEIDQLNARAEAIAALAELLNGGSGEPATFSPFGSLDQR